MVEVIIRFIFDNGKMAKITNQFTCRANMNSSKTMNQPDERDVMGRGETNRDETLLVQVSRYLNCFVK